MLVLISENAAQVMLYCKLMSDIIIFYLFQQVVECLSVLIVQYACSCDFSTQKEHKTLESENDMLLFSPLTPSLSALLSASTAL